MPRFAATGQVRQKTGQQGKRNCLYNYHTRDLNQFPFFNFDKRRKSQGVPNEPLSSIAMDKLNRKQQKIANAEKRMQSHFTIDTMPKLKIAPISKPNRNSIANKTADYKFNLNKIQSLNNPQARSKVAYWAGLRVEGGLNPMGRNADELTRWNDKIMNGGLFEKIGVGLQK